MAYWAGNIRNVAILFFILAFTFFSSSIGLSQPKTSFEMPPELHVRPVILHPKEIDKNANKIDDRLEERIRNLRERLSNEKNETIRRQISEELQEPIRVELIFSKQINQNQIDKFVALGGQIDYIYKAVSYGWNATVPLALIEKIRQNLDENLVAIVTDKKAILHLDEATRTGRVRPVWVPGFAGGMGYIGNTNTTIAIIDTGVDDSHPDLAGRMVYWKDYATFPKPPASPVDYGGHGSHVAGIALGTGGVAGSNPTTISFTNSGSLSGAPTYSFIPSLIHLPDGQSITWSSTAYWNGTSATLYHMNRNNGSTGGFSSLGSITGSSPLTRISNFIASSSKHYTPALAQNSAADITTYAVVNTVTYNGIGDGFNLFSGVAPGCRWAGAKVFANNSSNASSIDIGEAIDDLVSKRITYNIKVANISLGIGGDPGIDTTLRNKVINMVNNGIVVVCSAGNDGDESGTKQIDDPGRASLAITVAASNDINRLTTYTSYGFTSPDATEDYKPDLMAPGGSSYYSFILSVDTNDADAGITSFPDKNPNDYTNLMGTSMAAPFVAGASALIIQALEESGVNWNFYSSDHPKLVKMLLCATSTESNAAREIDSGSGNPTLQRATAPYGYPGKDIYEGYGLINPDAAIECIKLPYNYETITGYTGGGIFDRRAWGRKISLQSGVPVNLFLIVPSTADFDLYLYSSIPESKGNPVLLASSTSAGNGVNETLNYTPNSNGLAYIVIKRVSGSGTWFLTGPDTNPPSTPSVIDDGAYQTSINQIHASWSATDDSGIAEYQYAISATKTEAGIIPGGGWMSAGTQTQGTRTGLSLAYGQAYYVLVKARDYANNWSSVGVSDGIIPVLNSNISIVNAKLMQDNSTVGIISMPVTAIFSDCFYIQEGLIAGLRVDPIEMPAGLTSVGQTVEVGGTMTTVNGERRLINASCRITGLTTIKALAMPNRCIGGADWLYNPNTGAGQRGVKHPYGLNNIGLLIKTWGTITQIGTNYLYINDGSGLKDGTYTTLQENVGIRIICDPAGYVPGSTIVVTGISSCFMSNSDLRPQIKVRSSSDIQSIP